MLGKLDRLDRTESYLYTGTMTPDQISTIKTWLGSGSINIFGLPFAGKDTHGKTLSNLFDAPLLGGGDILRNSVIPDHVREIMDAGGLAPTEDYIRIVLPYLSQEEFAGQPIILSSVGRWIGEEKGVLAATEASGHPTKAVIYLHLSENEAKRRWEVSQDIGDRGRRDDDTAESLTRRFNEFREKTLPVIEAYRQKGLLIEVNSEADKSEVLDNILARLLVKAAADG